jgi:hypothetical protein
VTRERPAKQPSSNSAHAYKRVCRHFKGRRADPDRPFLAARQRVEFVEEPSRSITVTVSISGHDAKHNLRQTIPYGPSRRKGGQQLIPERPPFRRWGEVDLICARKEPATDGAAVDGQDGPWHAQF